jgi:hypothetical protein
MKLRMALQALCDSGVYLIVGPFELVGRSGSCNSVAGYPDPSR